MVYFRLRIGQFCNGMLGDRFHLGKDDFVGLAIAAGANLCMDLSADLRAMAVVWDQRACTGNDLATGDSDLRGDGEPGTEDEVLRQYRILTGW